MSYYSINNNHASRIKTDLGRFLDRIMLQYLTTLVAKNLKIDFLKMLHFLNLHDYEMYLFGLARLNPFADRYSSPAHPSMLEVEMRGEAQFHVSTFSLGVG